MAVTEWVPVGKVSDMPPGQGMCTEVDGVPVAVWNVGGVFYATDDTCTHEEASLCEGDLWGEVIECPLHGAQFDVRTGEVLSLPAVLPLKTYPVKVENGTIYVGKSDG